MSKRISAARLVFTILFVSILMVGLAAMPSVAQTTGTVYVNTNQVSNEVWSYTRATDGTLTFAGAFPTQGSGTGSGPLLNSQGAIILSQDGKYLVVVNTGSNEITSFSVHAGGQLAFVSKVRSGGQFPNSLANFGSLVYVLNSRGTPNVNAFRLKRGGVLKNMALSKRTLSGAHSTPTQVGFSNDGTVLVVAELINSKIDTFTLDAEGRGIGPLVQNSNGPGPFGFQFDNAGHLIVSEANNSGVSSYSVDSAGVLTVITGSLLDFGQAACWVQNTNSATFPNQYSYLTNTNSNTVSGYNTLSDGSMSLLNPDGITFAVTHPLDMAMSVDSQYLYVLEGLAGALVGLHIQPDGSLVQVTSVTGFPTSTQGMVGN